VIGSATRVTKRYSKRVYKFYDRKPVAVDLREDVLVGLSLSQKRVSSKYLYDEGGSTLFEAITELPEYYVTRTELALLETRRDEIATRVGPGVCLIEYGSGTSRKIRLLLERLKPESYVPVDISRQPLETAARLLSRDYPWLNVYPVCADYTSEFSLPSEIGPAPRVVFFPGSSIGNFEPEAAVGFLGRIAALVGPGGRLLIGVDRKKDRAILEAAYDDAAGVTAEFNRNMLKHLNATFDADFDPTKFSHVALYNETLGCIQMFLQSTVEQSIRIAGTSIEFRAGERIHTESSYKYDPGEFAVLAERAGLRRETWWTDERKRFAVFLFAAA